MFKQPNKLFLLSGVFLIAISFVRLKKTLDIHVHDTFYIIGLNQVCLLLGVLLMMYGLIYWWTGKLMYSPHLSWYHTIITIFSVLFIVSAPYWMSIIEQSYSNDPFTALEQRFKFQRFLVGSALFLLIGQLTYFINLIAGIVKRYL